MAAEPSGLPAGEGTGVRGIAPGSRPGTREVRPLRGDHAHHGRARRPARSRAGGEPGGVVPALGSGGVPRSPSGSPRRRGRPSSSPPPRTSAWSGRGRPELVRALAATGPRLRVVDPGLPLAGIADAIRWGGGGVPPRRDRPRVPGGAFPPGRGEGPCRGRWSGGPKASAPTRARARSSPPGGSASARPASASGRT